MTTIEFSLLPKRELRKPNKFFNMKTAYDILQKHHDFLQKQSDGSYDKPSDYIEQHILEAMEEYASQSKWVSVRERFKKPTDQQLVEFAILVNEGEVDMEKLSSMVGMCEMIIDRLHEHGDVTMKSTNEIELEKEDTPPTN
jgi:hypothetical protein